MSDVIKNYAIDLDAVLVSVADAIMEGHKDGIELHEEWNSVSIKIPLHILLNALELFDIAEEDIKTIGLDKREGSDWPPRVCFRYKESQLENSLIEEKNMNMNSQTTTDTTYANVIDDMRKEVDEMTTKLNRLTARLASFEKSQELSNKMREQRSQTLLRPKWQTTIKYSDYNNERPINWK